MIRVQEPDFPEFSEETVELRKVFGSNRIPVQLGGPTPRFSFSFTLDSVSEDSADFWVLIDLGTCQFNIGIDHEFLSTLFNADFIDVDPEISHMFLDAIFSPLLLSGALNIPHSKFQASPGAPPPAGHIHKVYTQFQTKGFSTVFPIWFDAHQTAQIVDVVDNIMFRKMSLDIPIPVSISAMHCYITMKELRELEVGDMIVVGSGTRLPPHELNVADRYQATLKLNEKTAELISDLSPQLQLLEGIPEMAETEQEQQKSQPESDDKATSKENAPDEGTLLNLATINELPVRVDFSLSDLEMTVEEISKVGKGYIFDLKAPPSKSIRIRIGGRIIGYGDIVSVNGSYGVRVLQRV